MWWTRCNTIRQQQSDVQPSPATHGSRGSHGSMSHWDLHGTQDAGTERLGSLLLCGAVYTAVYQAVRPIVLFALMVDMKYSC